MKRLTPAMKLKLVPFLPKLIWHWRKQVRTQGRMDEECPLCVAAGATGNAEPDCRRCPVFANSRSNGVSCLQYLPDDAWKSDAQRVLDFLLRLQAKEKTGNGEAK